MFYLFAGFGFVLATLGFGGELFNKKFEEIAVRCPGLFLWALGASMCAACLLLELLVERAG